MSERAPSIAVVLPGDRRGSGPAILTTIMPRELADMLEAVERGLNGEAPSREQWLDALKSVRFVCADLQELIDTGAFGCSCGYGPGADDDGGEDDDGGGGLPIIPPEAWRSPSDRDDGE